MISQTNMIYEKCVKSFKFVLFLTGFFGCGFFLVLVSFVGCNQVLAVVLLCLAAGINACVYPGYNSNHVDLSSRFVLKFLIYFYINSCWICMGWANLVIINYELIL